MFYCKPSNYFQKNNSIKCGVITKLLCTCRYLGCLQSSWSDILVSLTNPLSSLYISHIWEMSLQFFVKISQGQDSVIKNGFIILKLMKLLYFFFSVVFSLLNYSVSCSQEHYRSSNIICLQCQTEDKIPLIKKSGFKFFLYIFENPTMEITGCHIASFPGNSALLNV